MEVSRELPDRSNRDSALGMGLLRNSQGSLLPPVAARLLVFTATVSRRLLIWEAALDLQRGSRK